MAASRLGQRVGIVIGGTAILVLAGTCAFAQAARPPAQPAAPAQAAPSPAGTAQIRGVIKSSSDESAIGRARVIAAADVLPEPRVTISGADGKYTLS